MPWRENPFRLISCLEMNQFSAESCTAMGAMLGKLVTALDSTKVPGVFLPKLTPDFLLESISAIEVLCEEIGLTQSVKCTTRLVDELGRKGLSNNDLKVKLDGLEKLIISEMEGELFLWVPEHRAEFYSKDAEKIVGAECCKRFGSIQRELVEAVKCYAVGRYTASAFHLMRSTEAGVKALAKAIRFTPKHNQWELVFKQMETEVALPIANRPKHWKTHGKFLERIWGDLRAVSKAWRNDIAHLVDTYSEEDAKNLLGVVPMFLRDLATKMDERGKLY